MPKTIRVPFLHWKVTGHWPRLHPPKTFNEKLCWRKCYLHRNRYYRHLLTRTASKVTVRDYVAEKAGTELLTSDFHAVDNSRDLPLDRMPSRFVIKASHGSSWNHIVHDKDQEDWDTVHRQCDDWLSQSWGVFSGEWWYGLGKPQILAEEFLDDGSGQPPKDYKFFVMNGQPQMIQVDFDRFNQHKRNLYGVDWSPIDCCYAYPRGTEVDRPQQLDKMLDIACLLGQDLDFVRVDLYLVGERIVLGELTHCPESGLGVFSNPEIDRWLGRKLDLPML